MKNTSTLPDKNWLTNFLQQNRREEYYRDENNSVVQYTPKMDVLFVKLDRLSRTHPSNIPIISPK
jgi:hypothetical protein